MFRVRAFFYIRKCFCPVYNWSRSGNSLVFENRLGRSVCTWLWSNSKQSYETWIFQNMFPFSIKFIKPTWFCNRIRATDYYCILSTVCLSGYFKTWVNIISHIDLEHNIMGREPFSPCNANECAISGVMGPHCRCHTGDRHREELKFFLCTVWPFSCFAVQLYFWVSTLKRSKIDWVKSASTLMTFFAL